MNHTTKAYGSDCNVTWCIKNLCLSIQIYPTVNPIYRRTAKKAKVLENYIYVLQWNSNRAMQLNLLRLTTPPHKKYVSWGPSEAGNQMETETTQHEKWFASVKNWRRKLQDREQQRAIVEEAYDPPGILMPVKEEEDNLFINLCFPTSIEMATLCNWIFL